MKFETVWLLRLQHIVDRVSKVEGQPKIERSNEGEKKKLMNRSEVFRKLKYP